MMLNLGSSRSMPNLSRSFSSFCLFFVIFMTSLSSITSAGTPSIPYTLMSTWSLPALALGTRYRDAWLSDLLPYGLIVNLKHVSRHGCRCGKLAIAPVAREMTVLLMLQQDVGIVELLVAVVAEWLQHGHSTTLPSHFYYYFYNL